MIPSLNKWLSGRPDDVVTGLLFLVSAIAGIVAIFGTPELKIVFGAWFLFP